MRTRSFGLGLVLCVMVGCGGGGMADDVVGDDQPPGDDVIDPPATGFQLVSPDITLVPGEEVTKCWYFQTPNTVELAVKKWESQMTPGSHHMIVYFSNAMQQPPGTVTESCGITGGGGANAAVWTYSAQTPTADQPLPDGVGMGLDAGQYGFIQMHYINTGDADLVAHVTLNVETYEEGAEYIPAAPYITFNNDIVIPPNSTATFTGHCNVDPTLDFYQLGTHAHKQATRMYVEDGANMIIDTDNWSEPEGQEWLSAPFHRFASGTLDYTCEYNNTTDRTIYTGDSAATDEMCMAVGYMFPATQPRACIRYNGNDIEI
jgi:hypothetical protein